MILVTQFTLVDLLCCCVTRRRQSAQSGLPAGERPQNGRTHGWGPRLRSRANSPGAPDVACEWLNEAEHIPSLSTEVFVAKLATAILGGLLTISVTGTAIAQWYPPPGSYAPPYRGGYAGPVPAQYGACGPFVRPYYPPTILQRPVGLWRTVRSLALAVGRPRWVNCLGQPHID